MGKNLCRKCNLIFGSLSAFDLHRVGSFGEPLYQVSHTGKSRHVTGYTPCQRRCLTPAELAARGMVMSAKGWWVMPDSLTVCEQEQDSS